MKFYIADAFTESLFGGNPAGIVILENCDWPDDELMTKTAAELRYSETAFVMPLNDGTYKTRYFTPAKEVDLCGHATIATFTVLKKAGYLDSYIKEGKTSFVNHTLAGDLEIRLDGENILMEMGKPQIIDEITDKAALKELYNVMGLEEYGSHIIGANFEAGTIMANLIELGPAPNGSAGGKPVHPKSIIYPKLVSTGLPDIMLPVCDEVSLESIKPDFAALTELSKKYNVVGVHAFCPASAKEMDKDLAEGKTILSGGVTAHARNFAPLYDIDEEAATGTSNGALTYYLKSVGVLGETADACIIQGEKMGRPSVIRTHIEGEKIMVGGTAVILAEGEIHI